MYDIIILSDRKGRKMRYQYSAVMATFYGEAWHIDHTTQTHQMQEKEAIAFAHVTFAGVLTLYVESFTHRIMIEEDGRLVPAQF